MTDLHHLETSAPTPCIRGCTRARRHVTECEDRDECKGCFPRPAEHGLLCYPCHSRLHNLLTNAPGQYALLRAMAAKSGEQQLSQETIARIGDGWRLSNDVRHQGPYARASVSTEQVDPIRLAAIDAAEVLADVMSELVETVVTDYQAKGPTRLLSQADRDDPRKKVWKPGRSFAYDKVETHGAGKDAMTGYYVWVDPPAKFEIGSASRWLLAQIERLEHYEDIGDTMETFAEAMSQGHALAPWREQVARLKGIPCIECHRSSLVIYGGDEDVTCQTCNATMTPGRYAIWIRVLADRQKPEEQSA